MKQAKDINLRTSSTLGFGWVSGVVLEVQKVCSWDFPVTLLMVASELVLKSTKVAPPGSGFIEKCSL